MVDIYVEIAGIKGSGVEGTDKKKIGKDAIRVKSMQFGCGKNVNHSPEDSDVKNPIKGRPNIGHLNFTKVGDGASLGLMQAALYDKDHEKVVAAEGKVIVDTSPRIEYELKNVSCSYFNQSVDKDGIDESFGLAFSAIKPKNENTASDGKIAEAEDFKFDVGKACIV